MSAPAPERYAVVAGGSGFLGAAAAERLRVDGREVVVLDRVAPRRPGTAWAQVELTDETAVAQALDGLLRERGAPGALVLCQGWSPKGGDGRAVPEDQVPPELFRRVLDVNLTSCYLLLRTLVPAMAAAGGGRAVAVGSAAAHTGRTTAGAAYAAAKAGVASLVRTFAVRYGPDGVLVNGVAPGKVANPAWPDDPEAVARYREQIPAGRLGEADELADVIAFLVSPRNTYLTGQTVIVDGGRLA
ncbi:SDR family NAD(P)-dependent oxidoreductase [Kitasatospora sp. NPDC093550]|uniref:SDR family NAD(P)-dependent oxidoreductase n=1 Tax=Kitasatospora sp. NPDC093550 TaxID=3364089 RepID=UPI00382A4CFC